MKKLRIAIGVFTIILSLLVLFQSFAASAIEEASSSASAGLKLGACFIMGGIIVIAARRYKSGVIVAGIIYALGGIFGITNIGVFEDLLLWSVFAFVFAGILIISGLIQRQQYPKQQKLKNSYTQ